MDQWISDSQPMNQPIETSPSNFGQSSYKIQWGLINKAARTTGVLDIHRQNKQAETL